MAETNREDRPVAVVTGAGSGIGAAVCRRLHDRGVRVGLVGRNEAKLRNVGAALGVESEDWATLPTDVADSEAAAGLVPRALEAFGRFDVLINNAGSTPLKPIAEHTEEDVAMLFAVNATGSLAAVRAALPVMVDAGGGTIVNVSSMASADPFPGLGVYGSAKAAMNTMAKAIANEYGQHGVRAYAVAPGAVDTPLLRSLFPESVMPAEKCLSPERVAAVVVACALGESGEANGETVWLPSP